MLIANQEVTPLTQREKIAVRIFETSIQASRAVAQEISELIRARAKEGRNAVLGLATGSTPVSVYNELIRMHREEGLTFRNVLTFNLDEYFPMLSHDLQSYRRFMAEHLFDHVDIPKENANVPDGTLKVEDVFGYCQQYEKAIAAAGGLDIQILGIGRTGHIGFNEPGSARSSRTRLITLDRVTRLDAASDFFTEENVPRRAITMGVGTILAARRVILLAFGEHKAPVIAQAVEGPVSSNVAASFLQDHPQAEIYLDPAAAAELTRYQSPWELGPVAWDENRKRSAVIWLARRVDKPILKLTEEHYNEAGLQDLLAEHGPAYRINVDVFRGLQDTITGWPGGKPAESRRPGDRRRAGDDIFPKRAVIFSPHPDDDVISMGGTFLRLVEQGHEVHVAYQVSGAIAVSDDNALRYADFARQFNGLFSAGKTGAVEDHIEQFLRNKKAGQVDSDEVQKIKALIRRGEARAAGRYCGAPLENLHFLDMPFYETGRVRKKPLSEQDIRLIQDLLEKIKPHQIYAAGDLTDPHGTHRTCLAAITQALTRIRRGNQTWFADCEVWLYRGAWQEWAIQEIEMAVPLSPSELYRKRNAIFKHESQKDKALFPGTDEREFWQRAEDRNRRTAELYDKLGLAEYEGIEGFVRWKG